MMEDNRPNLDYQEDSEAPDNVVLLPRRRCLELLNLLDNLD